jgi:hypothetical protein
MNKLLPVTFLVGVFIVGCSSSADKVSLVGAFRGKSIREAKPKNGAFTTVYIPIYDIGIVFTEKEFSGSQQKDNQEPIVIRGKYELTGKNAIRFIAEDFANEVVVLDGVFNYSLKEKTLTLTKQDGSLKLVLTRLPER